jgi:hypothetical protein
MGTPIWMTIALAGLGAVIVVGAVGHHFRNGGGQPPIVDSAPSIDTPKQTDVMDEGSQRLPYTEIICNELTSKVSAGTLILLQSVGNQTDQLIADEYQKCLEGKGFKVLRTVIAMMAPPPGHKITLDKLNAPAVEVLIAPSAN